MAMVILLLSACSLPVFVPAVGGGYFPCFFVIDTHFDIRPS